MINNNDHKVFTRNKFSSDVLEHRWENIEMEFLWFLSFFFERIIEGEENALKYLSFSKRNGCIYFVSKLTFRESILKIDFF